MYWYQKAADQGHADAQNNLRVMHNNGNGSTQDSEQAFYWYKKSAEQGITRAEIRSILNKASSWIVDKF